jgi:hypothetical protein
MNQIGFSIAFASHQRSLVFVPKLPPFDFQQSIVGPPAHDKTLSYMSRRLAESALWIASTVLSNESNSHRQFASVAPARFNFEGSYVGPPVLAIIMSYVYRTLAGSAVLIGSKALSNDLNLRHHRFLDHQQSLALSILKEAL